MPRAFEPMTRLELANLADAVGDDAGRESELREAHRLFTRSVHTGAAETESQRDSIGQQTRSAAQIHGNPR